MSILKNKLLVGALAAIAVVALWYWWSSSDQAPALVEESSPLSGDLLVTLGSLSTLTLDETIFDDPTFQSLTDFGVPIPPQAVGRRNPFAPI